MAIKPFTRFVLWFDLTLLFAAGLQLNILPSRTEDLFAWAIEPAATAAFIGVSYWAAVPSAILCAVARDWRHVRILTVMAVALTPVIVAVTFRDLGLFFLGEGPFPARFAAWFWLIGYLVLPPLNLAALIVQERAASVPRNPAEGPMLPWAGPVLALYASAFTLIALGLLLDVESVEGLFPWPLRRLSGGAAGAWWLAAAVGLWWALREGVWARFRLVAPFYILYLAGQLVPAARFPGDLKDAPATPAYLTTVGVAAAAFLALTLVHEGRRVVAPPANVTT